MSPPNKRQTAFQQSMAMAGKRRSTAGENRRPKSIGGAKKKKAVSLSDGSVKKQTLLLSFWGKNAVGAKPKPKLPAASTPEKALVETFHEPIIATTPLSEHEVCNQQGVREQGENKQTTKDVSTTEAECIGSLEETHTSATITPCKHNSVPIAESPNDISCHGNETSTKEPDATERDNIDRKDEKLSPSIPAVVNDEDDHPGLSEYEKLRLRNIERNNARLAALGLLSNTQNVTNNKINSNNRRRPPRKKPKIHDQPPQQPLRRSTRNRNPQSENMATGSSEDETNTSNKQRAESTRAADPEIEEDETYTVSPLLEYEMNRRRQTNPVMSTSTDNSNPTAVSSTSRLAVTGTRFLPPKGLNAIYSLEFWNNSDSKEVSPTSNSGGSHWLVGAGKAGMIALWDTARADAVQSDSHDESPEDESSFVHPVLSWKAHSGRWIADAKFLPGGLGKTTSPTEAAPSRLLTAGNDGTVCLWDLSKVSSSAGAPKLFHRTGKEYHSSGIFSMDVLSPSVQSNDGNSEIMICTGSKDKSIAVSSLGSFVLARKPQWRSQYHTAKVGCVKLQTPTSTLLASASDDGIVALHDYRMNGSSSSSSSIVAELEDAHNRPHSVVWDPCHESIFVTAGLDPIVKVWDCRNLSKPIASLEGHVPTNASGKMRKIHRPTFFNTKHSRSFDTLKRKSSERIYRSSFLLTGGQGSSSVSMYKMDYQQENDDTSRLSGAHSSSLFSRGKLPLDCGDPGSIAVNGRQVAVAVDQGEVIVLEPSSMQI